MVFNKPIFIEKLDEKTGDYKLEWKLHACVNKTGGKNYSDSGAERTGLSLTFEVRYFNAISDIFANFQNYRIVYNRMIFYITDYDDYRENHHTVRLTGDCNGKHGN